MFVSTLFHFRRCLQIIHRICHLLSIGIIFVKYNTIIIDSQFKDEQEDLTEIHRGDAPQMTDHDIIRKNTFARLKENLFI